MHNSFYFCQKCQNFVALHRIFYKECESVDLSDAFAGNTGVCDLNFDLTVFLYSINAPVSILPARSIFTYASARPT